MHVLIVEDIEHSSNLIKSRIERINNEITLIDQAFTIAEANQKIKNNSYQIVFLDIQFPEGTTFDLLKNLNQESLIDFEVIFITGQKSSEYIINAIKFSAIDFLYKPLEDDVLELAIDKAIKKIKGSKYPNQIDLLLELVEKSEAQKASRIAIHLSKGVIKLFNVSDIAYLQADSVVTKVILTDRSEHIATKNLGYYKSFLISKYDFQAISHGTLVNMAQVETYNHSNLLVKLKNGDYLNASRRGGKEFKRILETTFTEENILIRKIRELFK